VEFFKDVQSEFVYQPSSRPLERSVSKTFSQAYELKVVYRHSYRPTQRSVYKALLQANGEKRVWRPVLRLIQRRVYKGILMDVYREECEEAIPLAFREKSC
jgi:hypothetical protein